MNRRTIKILRVLPLTIVCLGLTSLSWPDKLMYTATGYDAKVMCSSVFISGREPEDIEKNDLVYTDIMPVRWRVDRERREVKATVMGGHENRAVYRDGLGCTLVFDISEEKLASQADAAPAPASPLRDDLPWPGGEAVDQGKPPPEVDQEMLDAAMAYAFEDNRMRKKLGTRAVVVVYRGKIIAERYAEGFDKNTPLVGWSMTKSVTNALVGILVRQGKLDISAPAPVPQWQSPDDPRSKITLDQLLRMSSGLKWDEASINADIVQMMYAESDTAAFAANMPLDHAPDSHWSYSSGTTNIISGVIRRAVGGSDSEYFSFPYRELFHKLGMNSAVLEPDASGTFVGSSYMYATARDWARFGLLYLQDGVWEGKRILPEGWVEYSVTPTTASEAPKGGYGAQFWLNVGDPEEQWMPELPPDIYSARGLDGQFVTIIPSHQLVVVRLGLTMNYMKKWDHQYFLKTIIASLN